MKNFKDYIGKVINENDECWKGERLTDVYRKLEERLSLGSDLDIDELLDVLGMVFHVMKGDMPMGLRKACHDILRNHGMKV